MSELIFQIRSQRFIYIFSHAPQLRRLCNKILAGAKFSKHNLSLSVPTRNPLEKYKWKSLRATLQFKIINLMKILIFIKRFKYKNINFDK